MSNISLISSFEETVIRIITLDYFIIKRIFRKFLEQANNNNVLELGCGTGINAPHFSKKGYMGIDIQPDLVNFSKKHHPGYKFLVGDVTKIRLKKKFPTIIVVGVIHHLNDKEACKMVETIRVHLKKNGNVLILEAIPPIFKWNIIGQLDRKLDKGAFIRNLNDYKKFFAGKFKIEKAYNQLGGIADYGVFFLAAK